MHYRADLLSDTWNSSQRREPVIFPVAFLALPGPLLPAKSPEHVVSGLSSLSWSWSPRWRSGLLLGAPRDISGVENAVGAFSDEGLAPFSWAQDSCGWGKRAASPGNGIPVLVWDQSCAVDSLHGGNPAPVTLPGVNYYGNNCF